MKDKIEPIYNEIIEQAKLEKSDYYKVLYVHYTLIKTTTYNDSDNRKYYQSIISIFNEHKAVWAGYTYAFKLIMNKLDIKTISVRDIENKDSNKNHIWNMVNLYDNWFNIDLT